MVYTHAHTYYVKISLLLFRWNNDAITNFKIFQLIVKFNKIITKYFYRSWPSLLNIISERGLMPRIGRKITDSTLTSLFSRMFGDEELATSSKDKVHFSFL